MGSVIKEYNTFQETSIHTFQEEPAEYKKLPIIDNKLHIFLKSLTTVELNRFKRYLKSPYFNANEEILKLFYFFEDYIRTGEERVISKEEVWNLVFGNQEYVDKRFRKLMSDLLDLGEAFLAQEVYNENPMHQANYLLQGVHRKQIERMYNSATNTARGLSKKQFYKPADYYYYQYEIEKNLYKLQNVEMNRVNKDNILKINLEDIANNLDYFYLAEKLRYYCSVLSWNLAVVLNHKILFIDEIIKIANQDQFKAIPPIAIYLKIQYTFNDFENEAHFYELKNLIKKYIDLFPVDEAKEIFDAAINFTIQKYNKGHLHYNRECFLLYEEAIQKEIIFINGEMTPWAFKNIITNALRLEEYKWTEDFINEYSARLNTEFRENAINYNLATLHFYKKEFKKVMPLLQRVEFDEIHYGLDAKSILLATYYELDEIDALISICESFKIFVSRNKRIPDNKKVRYFLLIKYTKKLTEMGNASKSAIHKLKSEIENSNAASKKWLLEKVEELM